MSEGYVDYGPQLRNIQSTIQKLGSMVSEVASDVEDTQRSVKATRKDLLELKDNFEAFVEEQRNAAALQRALTEIVGIRQELDMKFGRHQEVREKMLGILQASNLALVKEDTIANCTQQLMLACPGYWLAPCLIAIAAWMGNNKTLANKALAEAIDRNDECTSLVMALVARRAGRVATSFIWLQRYFDMQNPRDMKESVLAYIDGYANGIFGEDKEHRCTESVDRWMADLDSSEGFRERQISRWKARYSSTKDDKLSDVAVLSTEGVCEEYAAIYELVARIRSREKICMIFDKILSSHVAKKDLINAVDENLMDLVERYEEEEAKFREKEEKMTLIIEKEGNMREVNKVLEAKPKKADGPVDLADILSEAIVDHTKKTSIRKTSIKFMSPYLKQAYKEYVDEKDELYPEEISLKIGGVSMKTKNGENVKEMKSAIEAKNTELCKADLAKVKIIPAIIFAILAVVGLIVAIAGKNFVTVIGVIITIVFLILTILKFVKISKKKKYLKAKYEKRLARAYEVLQIALDERAALNIEVDAFRVEPDRDVLVLEKEVV